MLHGRSSLLIRVALTVVVPAMAPASTSAVKEIFTFFMIGLF
jgi:hypothetical protein